MAEAKKKHAGGRPTKYNAQFHPKLAEALAEGGRINDEIAEAMGISRATLVKWMKEKPEFSAALKAGRTKPDEQVKSALFRRAVGYEHTEDKITVDPKTGFTTVTPTIKKYPPSETAMIFWLKNRCPDEWRERQDVQLSGKLQVDTVPDLSNLSEQAREELIATLYAKGTPKE